MAVTPSARVRRAVPRIRGGRGPAHTGPGRGADARRALTSPGQVSVIYRWSAWALAAGLIVSGSTATYGPHWERRPDVYALLGVTLAMNLVVTLGLHPYMRLLRRYPPALLLDVVLCLAIYARSNIWTSPFQFYSYASLMLPVTIFFFNGALAGSLAFLALDVALLYRAGDTLAWARAGGFADTYLMQLAIVPLLAFVFAYPNRLYAQLRLARQSLDVAERERLLIAERTRMAQSLHDSVAQVLFGIGMLAETALARLSELDAAAGAPRGAVGAGGGAEGGSPLADVLRQMRDMATRGGTEIRRAIYALNEPGPSRRGLAVSLRTMLADLAAHTGAATHFATPAPPGDEATAGAAPAPDPTEGASDPTEATPAADELLPVPVADVFYKVAREALANVERHAAAANVWVDLRMRPAALAGGAGRAELVVRDDGRGFRRPLLAQPGEPDMDELGYLHFGLGNMRRAVESVGGRLEITTAPGRGTTVHASAPVDAVPL